MELKLLQVILLSIIQNVANGHDLCMDGSFPKSRILDRKHFCDNYQSNSCCDAISDENVYRKYRWIVNEKEMNTLCRKIVQDILCQQCSPKSSHLYEGRMGQVRSHPHLCSAYCYTIYDTCKAALQILFQESSIVTALEGDNKNEFCKLMSNVQYCYPETDKKQTDRQNPRHMNLLPKDDCIPICLRKIVSGVKNIVDGAYPPDGSNRLFVVDQDGMVWELNESREKLKTPFLDIREIIMPYQSSKEERGLLGLTFHPGFSDNGLFYIFYNAQAGDGSTLVRVSEMKVDNKTAKVDKSVERILLEYPKSESNHNGGQLLFGKDGYLYISVGDGGGSGDKHGDYGNGQNKTSLLGKILRIDVNSWDEKRNYSIPEDNPFVDVEKARPEIYALGLRNPWRCSFDRKTTGELFCGDVGQNEYEEIDIIVKGGNYGWRAFEGEECYDTKLCSTMKAGEHKKPIYSYNHEKGTSVIGGFVYRGCNIPRLEGTYIFGDYYDHHVGKLFSLKKTENGWKEKDLCFDNTDNCPEGSVQSKSFKLFGFTEDQEGEIYFFAGATSEIERADGTVYKLIGTKNDKPGCK